MISTNDFRPGQTIVWEENIYVVLEFNHNKTARGAANIKTKLKNLRTGSITEHTFRSSINVPRARIEKVKMQYSYEAGNIYYFMNMETYDQIEVSAEQIAHEIQFIYPSFEVEILFFEEREVLGIELPDKVSLEVIEAAPGVKGDTKTNAMKDVTVETGLMVKVPLFIEKGERIIINTIDGSYSSRDR